MTSNRYLDKTQQRNIEWVTHVARPSSSFKMSESDSNSERSYDSEYNLSLVTLVSFAAVFWDVTQRSNFGGSVAWHPKRSEGDYGYVNIGDFEVEDDGNLGDNNGRQGRTITCNGQLKLSSNEYISFRDLPLLYEKIGGYLNILLSNCCCWIKCQLCISICRHWRAMLCDKRQDSRFLFTFLF